MFETKSTVWAGTLGSGLVNINISGRECLYLINASMLLYNSIRMLFTSGLTVNYYAFYLQLKLLR